MKARSRCSRSTAAALASLAAVVAELGHTPSAYKIALGLGTILLSWTFVHVIFALHYAYEFYADSAQTGGSFFPETPIRIIGTSCITRLSWP